MIEKQGHKQCLLQSYYKQLSMITHPIQTKNHNQYQLCKSFAQDPYQYFHKIIKNKNKNTNKHFYKYPLVRICDFGIAKQDNYLYKYCLHPDILPQKNVDCYQQDFLKVIKNINLLCCEKKENLFMVSNHFLGQIKFQNKNTYKILNHGQQRINKILQVKKLYLINLLLNVGVLPIKKVFNSWKQAKQSYIEKYYYDAQIQKIPIDTLFTNNLVLMFLFSKICVLIREQAHYQTKINNQNYNEETRNPSQSLLKLSNSIFQLAYFYHIQQFQNSFKYRCYALSLYKRKLLDKVTQCLQSYLSQYSHQFDECSFLKIIEQINIQFISHRCSDNVTYTKNNYKNEILKRFFQTITDCTLQIDKNKDKNWCLILNVMYQSAIFAEMAKDLGFYIPNSN